jgi:hypothetical protein
VVDEPVEVLGGDVGEDGVDLSSGQLAVDPGVEERAHGSEPAGLAGGPLGGAVAQGAVAAEPRGVGDGPVEGPAAVGLEPAVGFGDSGVQPVLEVVDVAQVGGGGSDVEGFDGVRQSLEHGAIVHLFAYLMQRENAANPALVSHRRVV